MNHCLLKTTLAALFAATAFNVSAANPFADVDTSSWAYQAVSQLSDQGVVDGYPDGTFKGDKNVSRYELAQIIARLMAKEESLNDSQRATVQKLSAEYAGELQSLGVRVKELEKKTGNLSNITEIRVQDIPRYDNVYKDNKSSHDELSLRVRLNTMANVNDRSTVYSQLETTMSMNGSTPFAPNRQDWSSRESSDSDKTRTGYGDGDFHMNRLWATYHFGPKQDTSKLPFGPSSASASSPLKWALPATPTTASSKAPSSPSATTARAAASPSPMAGLRISTITTQDPWFAACQTCLH